MDTVLDSVVLDELSELSEWSDSDNSLWSCYTSDEDQDEDRGVDHDATTEEEDDSDDDLQNRAICTSRLNSILCTTHIYGLN